jgi:hypothetical protein
MRGATRKWLLDLGLYLVLQGNCKVAEAVVEI